MLFAAFFSDGGNKWRVSVLVEECEIVCFACFHVGCEDER